MAKLKIGDIVRIVNPELFIRCRYEKEFFDFHQEAIENHAHTIDKMCNTFASEDLFNQDTAYFKLRETIIKGIARYIMEKYKSNGRKKYLETHRAPKLTNSRALIHNIRTVATGEYAKASYDFNPDTGKHVDQPTALINRKYHRILEVVEFESVPEGYRPLQYMIEDIHVRFLEKKTVDTPLPTIER